jgi:hypothetical protein
MAKFGIDSNMVFDADGKSVATRLSDHDTSLDGLSSSLAESATDLQQRGINVVTNGVDNTGTNNCSDAINQLITNNNYATLWFPDGVYNIDKEITLNNYCNLKLSANAVFKCVAITTLDKMINIHRQTSEKIKQFISGGVIDGNGKANYVIYSTFVPLFQIKDIAVKNALLKNIWLYAGYEISLNNIHIDNDLAYSVNPNVVGLQATCTDSVFMNIVIKNNTTGVINDSVSNEFYSVHPWGNDLTRLPNTVGLVCNDETHMHNFYADTCAIGVQINNGSFVYLHETKFLFSKTYLDQLPTLTPIFIANSTGYAYLYNCRLSSYGVNVIISNFMTRVMLYHCTFSSPFNTSTVYTNIQTYNHQFFRITLNTFTIAANSYTRLTIPIIGLTGNDQYFVSIDDSSQFTNWKAYTSNGNLNILYFNTSASSVSMNGLHVNLTLITNTNLPVTASTF